MLAARVALYLLHDEDTLLALDKPLQVCAG
jgi:hypothetical protein